MIQAEPQHNVGPRPLAQSYHTGDSKVVQHRDEAKSELKEGFKREKIFTLDFRPDGGVTNFGKTSFAFLDELDHFTYNLKKVLKITCFYKKKIHTFYFFLL